jgi:hypothetical protein
VCGGEWVWEQRAWSIERGGKFSRRGAVARRGEKKAADRRLQASDEIEIQIDSPRNFFDRMTGSTGWGESRTTKHTKDTKKKNFTPAALEGLRGEGERL